MGRLYIYLHEYQKNQPWLVVSTHLKNISQIRSFPQVGVKIKNIWNHHLEPNVGKDIIHGYQ